MATKIVIWAMVLSVTCGDFSGTKCPRAVQPAVITIADDSYNEFATEWEKLVVVAKERTSKTNFCFPFLPLERFDGVTEKDLEHMVVERWQWHKARLAATQSHYNLYKKHHEQNLSRPPQERTHLMVFEDDARCVSSTLRDLTKFLERLLHLGVDWDIIYIGGMLWDYWPMNSTGGEWLDMNDDYWRLRRVYDTEAVVINSQAIKKAAKILYPANQGKGSVGDRALSKAIETGELIGLISTKRSCIQPKFDIPYRILFEHKDRRWRAHMNLHNKYQLLPMHSKD